MQNAAARASFYKGNREVYLYGCEASETSRVNQVSPIVNKLASILYAPESIQFWVDLPTSEADEEYNRIEAVTDCLADSWHDTGLDLIFHYAVKQAIIDGCHIIGVFPEKMTQRGYSFVAYPIYPENFGVYRPGVSDLLMQQAVCMRTTLTMPEIEYRYGPKNGDPAKHAEWQLIKDKLESASQESLAEGRVFVTNADASSYSASGIAQAWYGGKFAYAAQAPQNEYWLYSLYVWDDDLKDYRLLVLSGDFLVSSNPISETGIPGCLPFIKVCPQPMGNYFWGFSLVHQLAPVQEWWNGRLNEVDEFIGRQLDPSIAGVGLGQEQEDKIDAYRQRGGYISIPNPQGKLQADRPEIKPEIFKFMEAMQMFFKDMSGVRPGAFGQQEPGIRTEGMAANLMRFSLSEPRLQALEIERQVEDAAGLLWHYIKRYSGEDDSLLDSAGQEFLPKTFSAKARIRVDGHSSSPIFLEDKANIALFLAKNQIADPDTLLDFLHPAMHGLMKHRLKREYAFQRIAKYLHDLQIQDKRSGEGMPRAKGR